MHRTSIGAALLPVTAALAAPLLLSACAGGNMAHTHDTPMAAAAAMPAPAVPLPEAAVLPSADAKPIRLDKMVLPGDDLGGGTVESGTPRTGAGGWAAHGEMDGVAWRFGSSDAGFLRVAGEPGIDWPYIQVAQSWGVKCYADGKATPCTILRLQPVEPGSLVTGGLSLDLHLTCVRAGDMSQPATIAVDNGAPVTLPAPDLCIAGAASDALQQQMLDGQTVTVTAGFYPAGPAKTISMPTHGLKQALALRAWILDKYRSGDLSPAM